MHIVFVFYRICPEIGSKYPDICTSILNDLLYNFQIFGSTLSLFFYGRCPGIGSKYQNSCQSILDDFSTVSSFSLFFNGHIPEFGPNMWTDVRQFWTIFWTMSSFWSGNCPCFFMAAVQKLSLHFRKVFRNCDRFLDNVELFEWTLSFFSMEMTIVWCSPRSYFFFYTEIRKIRTNSGNFITLCPPQARLIVLGKTQKREIHCSVYGSRTNDVLWNTHKDHYSDYMWN